jgi:phosphoglycolate phosphatase
MYKTVLFDLDGTLLNTIDDLADSANRVCAAHGWPQYETAQYRYFVGNGIPKLVERFSPASCRSPEQLAATLAEFDKVYGAHMHDKTAPYPGMPAACGAEPLHQLRDAVAHKIAVLRSFILRPAVGGADAVRGVGQVVNRVQQGPIQIKQYGFIHFSKPLCTRNHSYYSCI